jgi:hypothetical protein
VKNCVVFYHKNWVSKRLPSNGFIVVWRSAWVVVSHDVEEISPVTDHAWRMGPGGALTPEPGLALAAANAFGEAAGEFSGF